MSNEIIILCNSQACLKEISTGQWPLLHEQNIFTCNLAYTFFRTNGRHLNMFTDALPIKDFLEQKNWSAVYETYQYNKIEFILSEWELDLLDLNPVKNPNCKALIKHSPINVPSSSAINALMYLAEVENFDTIYLVGYTLNEWEGLSAVKELQNKKQALEKVLNKYSVLKERDFVFKYSKK